MIVVNTTMPRYPIRGQVLGYVESWRFHKALASPRRGTGALGAVVVMVDPRSPFPRLILVRRGPSRGRAAPDAGLMLRPRPAAGRSRRNFRAGRRPQGAAGALPGPDRSAARRAM